VRGREDIGQGQQILFQLEQGLELDSGNLRPYPADAASATPTALKGQLRTGFNRRSYVGWHSKNWGTLLLGRDYTAMSNVGLALDVMHAGTYGNLQSLLQLAGGVEGFGRVSDGLFYTSPPLGSWHWHASHGLPRQPGADATGVRPPKSSNSFYALGAQYAQGPWQWGGVYQTLQAPTTTSGQPARWTGQTQQREDVLLGLRHTLPRWSWSAGVYQARTQVAQRNLWLGAAWQPSPASRVATQVQRLRAESATGGATAHATVWGVNYVQQLSKRTALFATYGRTYNDAHGNFWLFGGDLVVMPTATGQQPRALGLGVSHRF
jgi:predicted porin